jgi:hypothetical protein
MTARVLLSGVLRGPVARRTAKNGNLFAIATVREGSGDAVRWWKIFVFSESAIEEIERLGDGEALTASGTFDATIWTPEGRGPRVNLTMTADAILSAHKPKQRKTSADKSTSGSRASAAGPAPSRWGDGGGLNDDIPF